MRASSFLLASLALAVPGAARADEPSKKWSSPAQAKAGIGLVSIGGLVVVTATALLFAAPLLTVGKTPVCDPSFGCFFPSDPLPPTLVRVSGVMFLGGAVIGAVGTPLLVYGTRPPPPASVALGPTGLRVEF